MVWVLCRCDSWLGTTPPTFYELKLSLQYRPFNHQLCRNAFQRDDIVRQGQLKAFAGGRPAPCGLFSLVHQPRSQCSRQFCNQVCSTTCVVMRTSFAASVTLSSWRTRVTATALSSHE